MQTETYCLMKVFIFTLLSCFWGNAYLGSYPIHYRSTPIRLYLAKASSLSSSRRLFLEPSQGFPVRAGALSASTPPGGLALRASSGTGQPQAVPFFPSVTGWQGSHSRGQTLPVGAAF